MNPRTIQMLQHVQSAGFGVAISGAIIITVLFVLVFGVATGFDLIGWE